jgi:anti-sigma regulatory factor (Ser/Thr protein kinase)
MCRRPVADDLSDVSGATAWVGRQVARADLAEEVRNNAEVCVEEALANLVIHARPLEDAKDIAVCVATDGHGATIVVTDRCVPFDSTRPPPPPASNGSAMLIGGRGLRLMRAFASELSYRTCEGRNELTMRFRPPV